MYHGYLISPFRQKEEEEKEEEKEGKGGRRGIKNKTKQKTAPLSRFVNVRNDMHGLCLPACLQPGDDMLAEGKGEKGKKKKGNWQDYDHIVNMPEKARSARYGEVIMGLLGACDEKKKAAYSCHRD